jgi:putative membrane protein
MKNSPVKSFIVYWFVCGLGIWIASSLLGGRINYSSKFRVIIFSGFILALVNTLIKPLLVLLSLPAIIFTLGLFMIVINGLMVMLVSAIYPSLQVSGFWAAMLAGMVIGLVNYLVSTVMERL